MINRFGFTTLLVMINILCLGLTLTLSQWLNQIVVITNFAVQIYLTLLVAVSIGAMLLVLCGKIIKH